MLCIQRTSKSLKSTFCAKLIETVQQEMWNSAAWRNAALLLGYSTVHLEIFGLVALLMYMACVPIRWPDPVSQISGWFLCAQWIYLCFIPGRRFCCQQLLKPTCHVGCAIMWQNDNSFQAEPGCSSWMFCGFPPGAFSGTEEATLSSLPESRDIKQNFSDFPTNKLGWMLNT